MWSHEAIIETIQLKKTQTLCGNNEHEATNIDISKDLINIKQLVLPKTSEKQVGDLMNPLIQYKRKSNKILENKMTSKPYIS